jgi:HD superfamily phosphohydrolase
MSQETLDEHRARIEAFAAELIDPYLQRAGSTSRRSAAPTKEFNDPVWGTVQVRAEEVFILDSPLLQRLRRIRQLGVVHYVYPAATHSRLEHSLGTLHQVQRLITTLNDAGPLRAHETEQPSTTHPVISERLERALRIAALCHDVGHGAMSHVSEYALADVRACTDLQLDFQRHMSSSSKKQLSEIAAYYMIGSPAFKRLAEAAARSAGLAQIDDIGVLVQNLIGGRRIDNEHILLHELISGPFDADKLDYVARDATMCGVPIVTDVHRLIQKVRSIRVDAKHLPAALKQRVQSPEH